MRSGGYLYVWKVVWTVLEFWGSVLGWILRLPLTYLLEYWPIGWHWSWNVCTVHVLFFNCEHFSRWKSITEHSSSVAISIRFLALTSLSFFVVSGTLYWKESLFFRHLYPITLAFLLSYYLRIFLFVLSLDVSSFLTKRKKTTVFRIFKWDVICLKRKIDTFCIVYSYFFLFLLLGLLRLWLAFVAWFVDLQLSTDKIRNLLHFFAQPSLLGN